MKKIYLDKNSCSGCGACVDSCSHNAISLKEDENGFLYPVVDENSCVDCGLCVKVCNFSKADKKDPLKVYAVSWNDHKIINSASGGAFTALGTEILRQGGCVYGCQMHYENKLRPIMTGSDNLAELVSLQGSKYVQAYSNHVYRKVKKSLLEGKQVLFSGTPCQVAGLYGYLRRPYENLITIDLICHGTPSSRLFEGFIEFLEKKEGGKIIDFKFRSKQKGWGNFVYEYKIQKEDKISLKSSSFKTSVYYRLFLSSKIYRDSCYQCPFAGSARVSDITIGDFWGVDKEYPELSKQNGGKMNFYDGVSCMLLNTGKGVEVYENLLSGCVHSKSVDYSKVIKYNHQLSNPVAYPVERKEYLEAFVNGGYKSLRFKYLKKEFLPLLKEIIKDILLKIKKYIK